MTDIPATHLRLLTTASEDRITLTLASEPVPQPGEGEVLVRMEAAPINPSDLGLLLGPADPATLRREGEATVADIPPQLSRAVSARLGQALPAGNEGAGTVVAAGPGAEALVGRTVAIAGGQMYAQYRVARARECLPLPEGTPAEAGASSFVNPMTALAMLGTMRLEGYEALVHTAAASNLGQMMVKLCTAEGVPLVNIVRSAERAALLRGIGATHVVNSNDPDFRKQLTAAITETGAFLAFDAIGGGKLANQILQAMEAAAQARSPGFSVYGSTQMKQVYLYGALDTSPTEITRGAGMAWGVGGWLLTPYLQRAGAEEVGRMRAEVAENLTTIFASHYTSRITLSEALEPETVRAYARRATGEKYLLLPNG